MISNQNLKSVPCDLQTLHSHMKKEIEACRSSFTAYDLLKTRGIRRISICLIAVWSENTPALPSVYVFIHLRHHVPPVTAVYLPTCLQRSVFLCRFSTSFAYYGVAMDLQKFGVSHLISINSTCELITADNFLYSCLTSYLRYRSYILDER